MTKEKRGRQQVRPVEQTSILDKRFKRVFPVSKRMNKPKIHPVMVIADLRKGSLVSLDRYLAQEGGIPDRGVAIELRKLISGPVCRTPFRMLVVDHPSTPKSVGGHPAGGIQATRDKYREIVESYEKFRPSAGKDLAALVKVAADFECSVSTVKLAIKSVREDAKQTQRQEREVPLRKHSISEGLERRAVALAKLAKARVGPSG